MSASLYDRALLEKIKKWAERTSIHIYSDQESTTRLFEVKADTENDRAIELPIISLRRSPTGFTILRLQRNPLSCDGVRIQSSDQKSLVLNAIPIKLQYQLDIYTRLKEEAEEYARNLVFNFVNYPKLNVVIPYMGVDYIHTSAVRLSANVEDNSDVKERLSIGQFTRYTLSLFIDDAYLWDVRERNNYSIKLPDGGVFLSDEDTIKCDC